MILRHKDTPDELYSLLWETIKSGKTFKKEESQIYEEKW